MKKRLTIRKYMHMQFLRIGFAVSGVVGVLALIGIYEGILLAKEDTRFDLATENKIAIIVSRFFTCCTCFPAFISDLLALLFSLKKRRINLSLNYSTKQGKIQ